MNNYRLLLLFAYFSILTAGCASIGSRDLRKQPIASADKKISAAAINSHSKEIVAQGLKYINSGEINKAQELFNVALKFSPDKSELHLLLATTYHLQYLTDGTPENFEKAKIGYNLASKYDPSYAMPQIQLGRLALDKKEYNAATTYFSKAIELESSNTDALFGMTVASYLVGDLRTALWATDELEKNNWDPVNLTQTKAVLFAAVQQDSLSLQYLNEFEKIKDVTQTEVLNLKEKITRINLLYKNKKWLLNPVALENNVKNITKQVELDTRIDATSPPVIQTSQPPSVVSLSPTSNQGDLDQNARGAPNKPWFDCSQIQTNSVNQGGFGQMGGMGMGGMGMGGMGMGGMGMGMGGMGMGGMMGGIGTGANADETASLPAPPSPCKGDPNPKMSVIDVVILRTEDQLVTSYGINVLNGLNIFFGKFKNFSDSSGTVTTMNSDFSGIGGMGSSSNGASALSYSLNIANSTNNRNEVLARPSLIAIDRLPSTFFAGDAVSISVAANGGGVSQLVDKQIGVSLSVTPTFIDDENLILSLKVVRSFAELPLVGTAGAALSVSKNSVTANVIARYGDTIVLGGLNERELIRGDSGAPILKDIPGIQYLFSQNVSTDYFRTVLVLVTPRKPISNDADRALAMKEKIESEGKSRSKRYSFYWRIEEYEKYLSKAAPNFDVAVETLNNNNLFTSFKSKDLVDTNWSRKPKLEQLVHNISELLWH